MIEQSTMAAPMIAEEPLMVQCWIKVSSGGGWTQGGVTFSGIALTKS